MTLIYKLSVDLYFFDWGIKIISGKNIQFLVPVSFSEQTGAMNGSLPRLGSRSIFAKKSKAEDKRR